MDTRENRSGMQGFSEMTAPRVLHLRPSTRMLQQALTWRPVWVPLQQSGDDLDHQE